MSEKLKAEEPANIFPANPVNIIDQINHYKPFSATKEEEEEEAKWEREREREILSPRDWLLPVRRIVAGQDPVFLHDSSGKSVKEAKSVLIARYIGAGICNKGGHSGGLGMGQVPT